MGFEGPAVEFTALREVVAGKFGEELQNARAGDQRRTRLPDTLHTVASVFHRASKDECAFQAGHFFKCGSLAELVRDGLVLHGSPRVVSQVPWRRRATLDDRTVLEKRRVRSREWQAPQRRSGGSYQE